MKRFAICLFSLLLLAACDSTDPWDPGIPDIPRTDVYAADFSSERVLVVYLRPVGEMQTLEALDMKLVSEAIAVSFHAPTPTDSLWPGRSGRASPDRGEKTGHILDDFYF